uniref:Uncharacterized protein n=1 Tax=Tanacetum cinerariifolium TaxID=118510 RepID=A0A699HXE2_TANCI|nr:hypothetical protein [Tanacetum cinerariifolium]
MSARIEKAATLSPSSFRKRYRSYYKTPSPSSSPTLSIRKRYRGKFVIILDTETEDECSDSDSERDGSEDEGLGSKDEGLGLDEVGHGLEKEGPCLEEQEEEAAPEVQQQIVLVVDRAMDEPLGLGYGALRCHELALGEGSVPSTFEVNRALVSPSSLIVPLPIASPVTTLTTTISIDEDQFLKVEAQLELHVSIFYDHMQCLNALAPTLFEGYDRDLRELYTRSRARAILALEAWACQTNAQRAALWHAIYDIQRENHDLRRQIVEERRDQLELTDRVARMERRHESGWE